MQNIFYYLYTSRARVETGVEEKNIPLLLYTKTMKKVDGSLCIVFVHEDF